MSKNGKSVNGLEGHDSPSSGISLNFALKIYTDLQKVWDENRFGNLWKLLQAFRELEVDEQTVLKGLLNSVEYDLSGKGEDMDHPALTLLQELVETEERPTEPPSATEVPAVDPFEAPTAEMKIPDDIRKAIGEIDAMSTRIEGK